MKVEKIKNITFGLLIVLIILLGIYLVVYINSESFACMSEPLVYGVNQFVDSQGEFTCSCSSPNSPFILVTKNGITIKPKSNFNPIKIG